MTTSTDPVTVSNDLQERIDYIREMADEIVAAETKTAEMRADSRLVSAFGAAGQVQVRTVDYSDAPLEDMGVNGTYPIGQTKLSWASYKLAYDVGKAFDFGHTQYEKAGFADTAAYDIAEYTRQQVNPTIDKARLARLVEYAGNSASGTLTAKNVLTAVKNGIDAIADAYNKDTGLTIYMTNATASLLDMSTEITNTRNLKDSGTTIGTRVTDIDGNAIVRVPNSYMTGASFAIHAPNTIQGIAEISIKTVQSAYNTRGNGDFVGFEVYHDAICFERQKAGLYAYKTASTSG